MKRRRRTKTTIVALLAMAGFASAVIGLMHRTGASAASPELASAAASGMTGSSSGRGQQYSMPFATVSAGGAVFADGSFAIVGQPIVGTLSNADYSVQVGAVAVMANAAAGMAVPGDFDGDGDIDLDDYAVFYDCMAGPGASPNPTPPTTVQECLDAFDFNADDDVDLADFGGFQEAFTG